jgi:hypothetical protein
MLSCLKSHLAEEKKVGLLEEIMFDFVGRELP